MITVACVKARPNYGHDYVRRLQRMVSENLHITHRFVCLTDNDAGLTCRTKRIPAGIGGWWAKLALHKRGMFDGKVIYFDLDTLILDDITFLAGYEGDFALLRDFYRPEGYGSGVMLWNRPHPQLWEDWLHEGRPLHPLGDQGWMEQRIENADRLQDLYPGKFVSYKAHCARGVPDGAAVCCFHGHPKQHDFQDNHWVTRAWRGPERVAA